MAQLIKIDQCVSRYQIDLRHYANRFLRLKRRRWAKWKERWETIPENGRLNLSKKKRETGTLAELKKDFNSWFFKEQILWATATSKEKSEIPDQLRQNAWLKTLLSTVNDVTFILYYPVLKVKSAVVQVDPILVTNDAVWCVKPLLGEEGSVFQESSQRKWKEIVTGGAHERMNPMISLNRTAAVAEELLSEQGIDIKVKSALVSPTSFIEFIHAPADVSIIDRRFTDEWLAGISDQSSTLKHSQLKAAEELLSRSETDAYARF